MQDDFRTTIFERMSLARDGFMTRTLIAEENRLRPAFDCVLLPEPHIRHTQWDHGDVTSRALRVWLAMREIANEPVPGPWEEGLWRHLQYVLLTPSGMACVPDHSDPAKGEFYYHMWDQGRSFDYLVYRLGHRLTCRHERPLLLGLIRRLQEGVLARAVSTTLPDGEESLHWPSDLFWNESTTLPEGRDFGYQNWYNWCIVTSQLLGPQVDLALLTGEQGDLDLAMRIARGFLAGHESRRRSTSPMFSEDGAFMGHFHGAVSGLDALVRLAHLLWHRGERELAISWIELAVRVWRWIFDADRNACPGTSCGCFPETAADQPSCVSELCCTADMIELAGNLARCAELDPRWEELADLWDDVERFTRNEILKTQLTDPARLLPHLVCTDELTEAEAAARLDRLQGTWASCRPHLPDMGVYGSEGWLRNVSPKLLDDPAVGPHTPVITSGGCCAYAGCRALCHAWQNAVVSRGDCTMVRIAAGHANGAIRIEALADGGVTATAARDHELRVRIPSHVAEGAVRAEGAGAKREGRWFVVQLAAGETVTVRWPLTEWETDEIFGSPNGARLFAASAADERVSVHLRYAGNRLIGITPRGPKIDYLTGL